MLYYWSMWKKNVDVTDKTMKSVSKVSTYRSPPSLGWLTECVYHRLLWICSTCHKHFPVLSSFKSKNRLHNGQTKNNDQQNSGTHRVTLVTNPVIMNEERTGKCLWQVEHIHSNLWYTHSVSQPSDGGDLYVNIEEKNIPFSSWCQGHVTFPVWLAKEPIVRFISSCLC
jgi:hypothetical protein